MSQCNNCNRPTCSGSCSACTTRENAKCVVYKPDGGHSGLDCFLGLPTTTNLEKILETLDKKLCNIFTVDLGTCGQTLLGLRRRTDFKVAFSKLLEYVCNSEDRFVKTSPDDTSSGYLVDKITTDECLKSRVKLLPDGVEKLELYIDYSCVASKLATCIEVNCCGQTGQVFGISSNVTTLCGNGTVAMLANNCLGTVLWYKDDVQVGTGANYTGTAGTYYATCNGNMSNTIEVTNSGACICNETIWTGTGNYRCQLGVSEVEQVSNCGNTRWIAGGSACSNCIPAWSDIIPVQIFCGESLNTQENTNIYNLCTMYIKQSNQCNISTRWVVYTGSGSENASECNGCTETTYTATRSEYFTKNDCPSGCVASSTLFTRVYTSLISPADAIVLRNQDYNAFNLAGQAFANLPVNGGTCTNCGCVPNGTFSCLTTDHNTIFNNSCNQQDGVITFEPPSYVCTGVPGLGRIIAHVTPSNGINIANYLVEYAITSIGGVAVTTPVYQTSGIFNNLVDDTTYVVTCRISRTGQTCTSNYTVVMGTCGSCAGTPATLSIVSSESSVCGSNSAVLTATTTNCGTIEWYSGSTGATPTLIGTGTSIVVSPTSTTFYKAKCSNCAGTVYESNVVLVSYTGQCIDTDYWNLRLCSDNSNATYQLQDSNLSVGVVVRGNNGICYQLVNQGALVAPLLNSIGYSEEESCQQCLALPPFCTNIGTVTITEN